MPLVAFHRKLLGSPRIKRHQQFGSQWQIRLANNSSSKNKENSTILFRSNRVDHLLQWIHRGSMMQFKRATRSLLRKIMLQSLEVLMKSKVCKSTMIILRSYTRLSIRLNRIMIQLQIVRQLQDRQAVAELNGVKEALVRKKFRKLALKRISKS